MESVEDVEFASLSGPLLSGRHAAVTRGMPVTFLPRKARRRSHDPVQPSVPKLKITCLQLRGLKIRGCNGFFTIWPESTGVPKVFRRIARKSILFEQKT